MDIVGERRWRNGQYVYAKASGEDWVSFCSADEKQQAAVTMHQWNMLPSEPENALPNEEWPYPQEG